MICELQIEQYTVLFKRNLTKMNNILDMKAKLEFNLDDKEDERAHKRCVKSSDMAIVLFELQNNLFRNVDSYIEQFNPSAEETKDFIMERINGLMEENAIVIEDLIE